MKSSKLFAWQHKTKGNDYYNFVYARDSITSQICGIIGFIPTYHFSANLCNEKEAWLAIWKVDEGTKYTGVGFKLLKFLQKKFDLENICSVGISDMVVPMYKTLKYEVGELTQYFLLNQKKQSFDIAVIPHKILTNEPTIDRNYCLRFIDFNEVFGHEYSTYSKTSKDIEYFNNRYNKHPIYKYDYLGIYKYNKILAFIVMRVVRINNSSCAKIVDFCGDLNIMYSITGNIYNIMIAKGFEYIDLYCHGMNHQRLIDSGYNSITQYENLVIPNYFEPFEIKNISIKYARFDKKSSNEYVIFRGDADQDRPSIL